MSSREKVQVERAHYYTNYDHLLRFVNYYYQTSLIQQVQPRSILEIGIGNKTVSTYLKQFGYQVSTCDFDSNLEPDIISDIRSLPFSDHSYEAVLACEIIEHVPWSQVPIAISEISRVTSKYAIISVPYCSKVLEVVIRPPFIRRFTANSVIGTHLRIPCFYQNNSFDGEHYWEMGRRGSSKGQFKAVLNNYFEIKQEIKPLLDPYHYFFVLEK